MSNVSFTPAEKKLIKLMLKKLKESPAVHYIQVSSTHLSYPKMIIFEDKGDKRSTFGLCGLLTVLEGESKLQMSVMNKLFLFRAEEVGEENIGMFWFEPGETQPRIDFLQRVLDSQREKPRLEVVAAILIIIGGFIVVFGILFELLVIAAVGVSLATVGGILQLIRWRYSK